MSELSSIESDTNIDRTRIELLGRFVSEKNLIQFKRILNTADLSGVYDITDWTCKAVRVLLEICSSKNRNITLKQNSRYFMPVNYPRGPLLEKFVETILFDAP